MAMKSKIFPEGIDVSYLVFGCITRFSSTDSTLPERQQGMDSMQAARSEIAIISVKLRIRNFV